MAAHHKLISEKKYMDFNFFSSLLFVDLGISFKSCASFYINDVTAPDI